MGLNRGSYLPLGNQYKRKNSGDFTSSYEKRNNNDGAFLHIIILVISRFFRGFSFVTAFAVIILNDCGFYFRSFGAGCLRRANVYMENTSVHGLRYIIDKDSHWIER